MSKIVTYISVIFGVLFSIAIIVALDYIISPYINIPQPKPIIENTVKDSSISFTDTFIIALAKVESNNNPKAFNKKTNAAGLLQITPIYVREINKYNKKQYTLNDRFDSIKNIEMFKLFNQIHNPSFDVERAIFLHNPKAGNNYRLAILKQIKI